MNIVGPRPEQPRLFSELRDSITQYPERPDAQVGPEFEIGVAVADDVAARGIDGRAGDILVDERRPGLATGTAVLRKVRAYQHRMEPNPLRVEHLHHQRVRSLECLLRKTFGSESVLVRDHHEPVAGRLQRQQGRNDPGH